MLLASHTSVSGMLVSFVLLAGHTAELCGDDALKIELFEQFRIDGNVLILHRLSLARVGLQRYLRGYNVAVVGFAAGHSRRDHFTRPMSDGSIGQILFTVVGIGKRLGPECHFGRVGSLAPRLGGSRIQCIAVVFPVRGSEVGALLAGGQLGGLVIVIRSIRNVGVACIGIVVEIIVYNLLRFVSRCALLRGFASRLLALGLSYETLALGATTLYFVGAYPLDLIRSSSSWRPSWH